MHDKINTLFTGFIGAVSIQASNIATDTIIDVDIAALTQTIVNILIGIITIYKLFKPSKLK